MRLSVAAVNVLLGIAYLVIGTIVLIEFVRERRTRGFSHFGAAFIALAFTCGPHHLDHGLHVLVDRQGAGLDLVAVTFGIPAAAAFALLRVEAFVGGRGDRWVSGTPMWMMALPMVVGGYMAALVVEGTAHARPGLQVTPEMIPNLLLVGIYWAIAVVLLRTQLRERTPRGGWSISGLGLAGVFLTCAPMHAVMALYLGTGTYTPDAHGYVIGWLAVPAGLYFLWTVHSLYRGTLQDWNRTNPETERVSVPT